MYDIDEPPADVVVSGALNDKQAGKLNPNGVQYFDQLWEQLEDIHEPLSVVIRTEDLVIDQHPIGAFWSFRGADNGLEQSSELRFDLPDAVCQAIQGHHANKVADRFFGLPPGRRVLELSRENPFRDEQRRPGFYNHGAIRYIEPDNWQMMRKAIEATARSRSVYIGGTLITTCRLNSNHNGLPVHGRVRGNQLQLFLTKGSEADVIAGWQQGFRAALGL